RKRRNLIRRDQRVICYTPRLAVGPVPLSTTPVPLRKSRARHERQSRGRKSGGLPSAARKRSFRSRCDAAIRFPPLSAPLPRSPNADRSFIKQHRDRSCVAVPFVRGKL